MEFKGLRIFITGGAGFIGSHLADALLNMGASVIIYDNLDEYYFGKEANIQHNLVVKNFSFIRADILHYDKLLSCMRNVDFVIHLAAQPGVRYSMNNPIKTYNVNVLGTLNVLRAAKEVGVKKVIFTSSSSVYGNPEYLPVDERHPTNPISIYGTSKLMAEVYSKIFYERFSLPVIILRYFTVYGPRQRPDMAFHRFIKSMFKRESIEIFGNGNQMRDFIYIDDVVEATINALEENKVVGEIINIGSNNPTRIIDTVKMLAEILNIEPKIVFKEEQKDDVKITYANITKISHLLGWKPKTPLKEGLKKEVLWMKQTISLNTIQL